MIYYPFTLHHHSTIIIQPYLSNVPIYLFSGQYNCGLPGQCAVQFTSILAPEGGITGMHWWLQYLHAGTWSNAGRSVMYFQCTDSRKE